ncbi:MAG: flagellar transcriptional regulator FlhC [Variovorax sp.]|nr:MAG: flagellar transcriptional regulator FlhC [Variovorax sp.]
MASTDGLVAQARHTGRAIALIQLGARMQVIETETQLPYERLLRLYKEVAKRSPSKGQLPFSQDWFLTWQPNLHASLFHNIYQWLRQSMTLDRVDALIKAYGLYGEALGASGLAPQLTITRAWSLIRFIERQMLDTTRCVMCGGNYVTEPLTNARYFSCGLCRPPARAGKGAIGGGLHLLRNDDPELQEVCGQDHEAAAVSLTQPFANRTKP